MFFVTNEPKLFNVETGVVVASRPKFDDIPELNWNVLMGGTTLFTGSAQECDDFIFSLAGWVGAVNPVTLERASNESAS